MQGSKGNLNVDHQAGLPMLTSSVSAAAMEVDLRENVEDVVFSLV